MTNRTRRRNAYSAAPAREASAPGESRIQSIGRARALLDAMAGGDWVSLRDLAQRTGLAKTTAFNLINALVDTGLAERDRQTGVYRLSLQHLVYGKAVERRIDIAASVKSHLVRLCAATRETINLALPCPTDVLIVESLEGTQAVRVSSYAGTRAAYHSTACGRALLAHRSEAFRRTIYSLGPLSANTDRTITDPDTLEAILARCRATGWATEFEENEIGSACVAAPIFGPDGEAVAAVSIAGPAARFEDKTIARLGALLVEELAAVPVALSGGAR